LIKYLKAPSKSRINIHYSVIYVRLSNLITDFKQNHSANKSASDTDKKGQVPIPQLDHFHTIKLQPSSGLQLFMAICQLTRSQGLVLTVGRFRLFAYKEGYIPSRQLPVWDQGYQHALLQ
jgi:hypothetical protein